MPDLGRGEVTSSDVGGVVLGWVPDTTEPPCAAVEVESGGHWSAQRVCLPGVRGWQWHAGENQIGRASCRERV